MYILTSKNIERKNYILKKKKNLYWRAFWNDTSILKRTTVTPAGALYLLNRANNTL